MKTIDFIKRRPIAEIRFIETCIGCPAKAEAVVINNKNKGGKKDE